MDKAPPPGFALTPSRGKFTLHNGPSYRATAEGDVRTGLWVLDRHCNGMGFLHGGMASSFADSSVAWAIWDATGRRGVTIKLTMEFFGIINEGEWLEAHPGKVLVHEDMAHISADLVVKDKTMMRADAIFRLLRRNKK